MIDHTADIGINVWGKNLTELFETAAYAMFDQIIDGEVFQTENFQEGQWIQIAVSGIDAADLMANWLRALLFFWHIEEKLLKAVAVHQISECELKGAGIWAAFNPKCHALKAEIKAVTYHQLCVEKTPEGFESFIIFDV